MAKPSVIEEKILILLFQVKLFEKHVKHIYLTLSGFGLIDRRERVIDKLLFVGKVKNRIERDDESNKDNTNKIIEETKFFYMKICIYQMIVVWQFMIHMMNSCLNWKERRYKHLSGKYKIRYVMLWKKWKARWAQDISKETLMFLLISINHGV